MPTRSAKKAAQKKPARNASSATNLNNTASLKYSRMELIVSTGTKLALSNSLGFLEQDTKTSA